MVWCGPRDGSTCLKLAASECHPAAIGVLLGAGLNVEGPAGGEAPLLVATAANCPDAVKVLLDRKANINIKDGDGRTALIVATAGNMLDLARVLLERGADMDVEDSLGRTALMYASMNGREEMAEMFRAAKAKKK